MWLLRPRHTLSQRRETTERERDRGFSRAVSPMSSGSSWQPGDDETLRAAVGKCRATFPEWDAMKGTKEWTAVAKIVGRGRTGPACQARWITALSDDVYRGPWTEDEDAALLKLMADPTTNSWSKRGDALAALHQGRRRGGGDTWQRYFLLKKKPPVRRRGGGGRGGSSRRTSGKREGHTGARKQRK